MAGPLSTRSTPILLHCPPRRTPTWSVALRRRHGRPPLNCGARRDRDGGARYHGRTNKHVLTGRHGCRMVASSTLPRSSVSSATRTPTGGTSRRGGTMASLSTRTTTSMASSRRTSTHGSRRARGPCSLGPLLLSFSPPWSASSSRTPMFSHTPANSRVDSNASWEAPVPQEYVCLFLASTPRPCCCPNADSNCLFSGEGTRR